ncbi:MAG: phenylalanine--tRNA ligase subunit beta [Moraxella sp.]|nr:phenylalanine--tRNA ligase subunit beta [Moraxella sp.]
MKLSENWLRQWVNPSLNAEQIGEQLTMAGLELDGLEKVAREFQGVVVGEVLEVVQHPDADKLKVTKVNVGEHASEPLQIVCGAPNVAVGVRVPVALVGAELPPVDDKPFKIKKGKLRGVESHGMLCGGSEIDVDDGVDGLLILPSDAPIGMDVRAYLGLDNHVLDISITPNRGDCFSVRGIARELAVLNKLPFALPFEKTFAPIAGTKKQAVRVEAEACPRYFAQVVTGLSGTTASPAFIRDALLASGIKPRNLLVDVTNFVLMELGQPLHAFDADKLVGEISVRIANAGETLTLLNEQEITLAGDELVICDEAGVIALAGIMGGLRTAVTDETTAVVIESAFFDPLAIAGRARRFGLHTDASQRFERGVDFDLPSLALDRAVSLLHTFGAGVVHEKTLVENVAALPKRETVLLAVADIEKRLGLQIEASEAVEILNRLEISTEEKAGVLYATPPSHRYDIAISEDLTEEIARIYGYDNIKNQLPAFSARLFENKSVAGLDGVKSALVGQGYYEAISFSFSDAKVEALFDGEWAAPLALANPISSELAVMRRTLLSSLLPCVLHNLNRQNSRVRLFETGLAFHGDSVASLEQVDTVALVATGSRDIENPWTNEKTAAMDFYDLKADVESILPKKLLATGEITYQRSRESFLHTGQSADIFYQEKKIGYFGQLHPKVAKALDLGVVWVAELNLAEVLALQSVSTITAPSKFPQVRRDFAFLVDSTVAWQDVLLTARKAAGEKLTQAWLFDVYAGDRLPLGKKSLAFALVWQDTEDTLTDETIKSLGDKVVTALSAAFDAKLRDS